MQGKGKSAIVCLDGYSPKLTVTGMIDDEGMGKVEIIGTKNKADLMCILHELITSILDNNLLTRGEIEVMVAVALGSNQHRGRII